MLHLLGVPRATLTAFPRAVHKSRYTIGKWVRVRSIVRPTMVHAASAPGVQRSSKVGPVPRQVAGPNLTGPRGTDVDSAITVQAPLPLTFVLRLRRAGRPLPRLWSHSASFASGGAYCDASDLEHRTPPGSRPCTGLWPLWGDRRAPKTA